MIDLHSHTFFSDGELVPSELLRRAEQTGIGALAITDHCDASNVDLILPGIVKVCREISGLWKIKAIPGVELTHVPPESIARLAQRARNLGAGIVVVHGETITEPVHGGTNEAAIRAKVDILAHPGLIKVDEVRLARENGVCLEITGRKGHCLTNGHLAGLAKSIGAKLVINSDAHAPGDLMDLDFARKVAAGSGMTETDFGSARQNAMELVKRAMR